MDQLISISVRMYYTGFGDCFLLTFRYAAPSEGKESFKTLWIDFGVRSGKANRMKEIANDVTKYLEELSEKKPPFVDVMAITHEHQDHISGLKQAKKELTGIKIGQAWFAWTEDPDDDMAQTWRRHKTRVKKTLQKAAEQVKLVAAPFDEENANLKNKKNTDLKKKERIQQLNERLGMVTGFDIAKTTGSKTQQEDSSRFMRHPSYEELIERSGSVCYLTPGYTGPQGDVYSGDIIAKYGSTVTNATFFEGVNIYVLGPPKDLRIIKMSEPGNWDNTLQVGKPYNTYDFSESNFSLDNTEAKDFWYYVRKSPFDEKFVIPIDLTTSELPYGIGTVQVPNSETITPESAQLDATFKQLQESDAYKYYFDKTGLNANNIKKNKKEEPESNSWRRIDNDYLYEADDLAIKLNTGMNNTSLVLAIEIEKNKEVLLFTGDAEFGVWDDWENDRLKPKKQRQYRWELAGRTVTVEDLLARSIFYKMGHHGSENATPKSRGINKLSNNALHSMIPVDQEIAESFKWTRIPFLNLLASLDKRDIPYVRADKSHDDNDNGGVVKAKARTSTSPLNGRVEWNTKQDTKGDKNLYVDWTLQIP